MKKALLLLILNSLFFYPDFGLAQTVYQIDASQVKNPVSPSFVMGNPGPAGKEIKVNSRYVSIGGKVVVPVMGEMHFARVPRADWEDAILKMKANGVNIIATYIFWIHHEEIEGKFDWSDNKDLRAFVQLCQKHQMYVYPRVGPWCHGEARNGGTPDWLLLKKDIHVRSNDPQYQKYVDRWFAQIGDQLKGLTYKDNGPVIGVQLENEFVQGKAGEAHIIWLKKTAVKYGLDVPMYTVTGWGNSSVPKKEVLPLFGAYPDEPWADYIERTTACDNFQFTAVRNDEKIGNALKQNDQQMDLSSYPYFTCEMGMGIDNTSHRRLNIGAIDGYGLVTAKLGSGSNLIGYYMFTGGLNPTGVLNSMEENMLETGSYSNNPAVAYDFQAAIGKSGALAPSYQQIKKIHYFLNEFGSSLAPMEPVFVQTKDNLQLSIRAKDDQAFLFGINYCRHNTRPTVQDAQFTVKLKNETITFPSHPVNIPDSSIFIWPVNFYMEKTLLKYATAQPLCTLNSNGYNQWIFIQSARNNPEFCFDAANIDKLTSTIGTVTKNNGRYTISDIKPGYQAVISIEPKSGTPQKVIILSEAEALQTWLLKDADKKFFFISNANMYLNQGKLHIYGTTDQVSFKTLGDKLLPADARLMVKTKNEGLFTNYNYTIAPQKLIVDHDEQSVLQNAKWLVINNPEKLTRNQVLSHHFFVKTFDYELQSKIKSAKLMLAAQSDCRIQVNGLWVNQPAPANQLNTIDLTGYLAKGENKVLLEFPYSAGKKAMAAKLVIDSYNNNKMELLTDSTWLANDAYNFPSYLTGGYPDKKPQTTAVPTDLKIDFNGYKEYTVKIPAAYPSNLSNIYLKIRYNGDRGQLFSEEQLIEDNFNNDTYWTIGLNRFREKLAGKQLKLQLYPLKKDALIYFDVPDTDNEHAGIKDIKLLPEYQYDFKLSNKKE